MRSQKKETRSTCQFLQLSYFLWQSDVIVIEISRFESISILTLKHKRKKEQKKDKRQVNPICNSILRLLIRKSKEEEEKKKERDKTIIKHCSSISEKKNPLRMNRAKLALKHRLLTN